MDISVVQFDIAWCDPEKNFEAIAHFCKAQPPKAGGLLVLPEMFSTGFCMDSEITSAATEDTLGFMKNLAWQYNCHVIGGLVMDNQNVAACIGDEGELVGVYAKQRLFTPAGEDQAYKHGTAPQVFDIEGVKVSPIVCYDLRFPELFRQCVGEGAEVFVVIASWPMARREHWRSLLVARAIENQAYVVGSNRIGKDPKTDHAGDSMIVDSRGKIIADFQGNCGVMQSRIDMKKLRRWREKFPVLRDAGLR